MPPDHKTYGRYERTIENLDSPSGLAYDAAGLLYIAESGKNRIVIVSPDGSILQTIGDRSGPGELIAPQDVSIDGNGGIVVADTGHHRVICFDAEGKILRQWGRFGSGPGQFRHPQSIAANKNTVVVADTGNHRIQVFNSRGDLRFVIGHRGTEPGSFLHPVSVSLDEKGSLFVADLDNHRIQKFSSTGEFINSWGEWGAFPGLFSQPVAVACSENRVYVTDELNHRVQVFDNSGNFLYQWGMHALVPREGEGKIHYPNGLAIHPDGKNIVISEAFENRCQIFGIGKESLDPLKTKPLKKGQQSHFGTPLSICGDRLALWEPETRSVILFNISQEIPIHVTRFGGWGRRFGTFGRLGALALTQMGQSLLTWDSANQTIQEFAIQPDDNQNLRFDFLLSRFVQGRPGKRLLRNLSPDHPDSSLDPVALQLGPDGQWYMLDGAGLRMLVFDKDLDLIRTWDGSTDELPQFVHPRDFDFSPDGQSIYIVDEWKRQVMVFSLDGAKQLSWEGASPSLPFARPSSIAVDPQGFVYVTDAGLHTILKFDQNGKFIKNWGVPGKELGELWKPEAIAIDSRNRIFVVDFGNHRAQIFSPEGEWLVSFGIGRASTRTMRPRHKESPPDE